MQCGEISSQSLSMQNTFIRTQWKPQTISLWSMEWIWLTSRRVFWGTTHSWFKNTERKSSYTQIHEKFSFKYMITSMCLICISFGVNNVFGMMITTNSWRVDWGTLLWSPHFSFDHNHERRNSFLFSAKGNRYFHKIAKPTNRFYYWEDGESEGEGR